jgi:putative ABC transport system substrate-binding protein
MRRRQFIGHLVGWTAASLAPVMPMAAELRRIGFLTPRTQPGPQGHDRFSEAFIRGLSGLGYAEGRNLAIEWRYADGDYRRLAGFAAELVAMQPEVLVTYGTAAARVLQQTKRTVPIVVAAAVDLVGAGIVASLARPGGNITGLSVIDVDISTKQLQLLKAFSPGLVRIAVLTNPGNAANPAVLHRLEASAPALGVAVVPANAATPEAIDAAFAFAASEAAGGMIVAADAFFSGQGARIAAAAFRHRLPTISIYEEHVLAGCLMIYGQDVAEFHRRAATYVDRILKGAKPEDLPIEQPTHFDLVINAKTAAELGLTIPDELLGAAERVIE